VQALNGPPIPALAFCVGISGHRNLPAETTEAVRAQLTEALREISIGVARVAEEHPHFYAEGPTRLSLLSQLAAGADQMAAEAALKLGYGLRTVLPFSRESFARDFLSGHDCSSRNFEALVVALRRLIQQIVSKDFGVGCPATAHCCIACSRDLSGAWLSINCILPL